MTIVKIAILAALGTALALGAANAQSGHAYDWRSGNSYSYNTDLLGNTHVRGLNTQNGTNWTTTIRPNGSMNGLDGGGNSWSYNSGTGFYMNYGTGRSCIGKGAYRTCY